MSVFGLFSVGGSGGSQGSQESNSRSSSAYGRNNSSSNSSNSRNSSYSDRSSSTVTVGQVKDCDSNNAAAVITTIDTNRTAKAIANINADVSKYGIDAQVKIKALLNACMIRPHPQPFSCGRRELESSCSLSCGRGLG